MLCKVRSDLDHLKPWIEFRDSLEFSSTPFQDVSLYFERKLNTKNYTDPYDQSSWPTPWELIYENQFCSFNIILAICYTLQLTERFKNIRPVINLVLDKTDKTVYYLLLIDDKVYGYQLEDWCSLEDLPKSLITKKTYVLDSLQ
jgi:hypothetical protein